MPSNLNRLPIHALFLIALGIISLPGVIHAQLWEPPLRLDTQGLTVDLKCDIRLRLDYSSYGASPTAIPNVEYYMLGATREYPYQNKTFQTLTFPVTRLFVRPFGNDLNLLSSTDFQRVKSDFARSPLADTRVTVNLRSDWAPEMHFLYDRLDPNDASLGYAVVNPAKFSLEKRCPVNPKAGTAVTISSISASSEYSSSFSARGMIDNVEYTQWVGSYGQTKYTLNVTLSDVARLQTLTTGWYQIANYWSPRTNISVSTDGLVYESVAQVKSTTTPIQLNGISAKFIRIDLEGVVPYGIPIMNTLAVSGTVQ